MSKSKQYVCDSKNFKNTERNCDFMIWGIPKSMIKTDALFVWEQLQNIWQVEFTHTKMSFNNYFSIELAHLFMNVYVYVYYCV